MKMGFSVRSVICIFSLCVAFALLFVGDSSTGGGIHELRIKSFKVNQATSIPSRKLLTVAGTNDYGDGSIGGSDGNGIPGSDGSNGSDGNGIPGSDGSNGPDGNGIPGSDGSTGSDGNGIPGSDGSTVPGGNGIPGSDGSNGPDGNGIPGSDGSTGPGGNGIPGSDGSDGSGSGGWGGFGGPDGSVNRIGAACSKRSIDVFQGQTAPMPNGIPTYTVEVQNICVSGKCTIANIHLNCGWFSSARLINPSVFRRLTYNDCLVNNGQPLGPGQTITFSYANTYAYPMAVSSVACF
ncbi:uncharacterized protein LOC108202145 [Daucus carota subsp. sativus]|nr:PREDICTED: uncharacterized PE-PGRS family protein PE_PGRS36-like isoform X4 [Daucus carota subsp. sativus]